MKVFWSWQSDTPGKIGRHFVRDALKDAIDTLKRAPDIEEPTSRESREALHLDQDRSGVPGSPDLAQTILKKIEQSTVFVADVTAVGTSADGKKRLINPNVAIELGYALHALTDKALLMVMNESYGTRDDLPFDLRHKAGPIPFRLGPNADKKAMGAERHRLTGELIAALRPYLGSTTSQPRSAAPFAETPHKANVAVYFDVGEHLATVGEPGEDQVDFAYASTNGLYLRVIPTQRLVTPLRLSDLSGHIHRSPFLQPLQGSFTQSFRQTNNYGAIICEPDRGPYLKASTQVFRNGEIWGFNAHLLTQRTEHGTVLIPSMAVERTLARGLLSYIKFAREALSIQPPYTVEAGLTGIDGAYIAMPENETWGPIHKAELFDRVVLNDSSDEACDRFLLALFEQIYDLTGYARPQDLYGFPP